MEESLLSSEQAIVYQGGYGGEYGRPAGEFQRQVLDEVKIRELLIDHVGHRCCWGSRPARTWKIHAIEDCNVYIGTLDTFIEEREVVRETEAYVGGNVDGKDKGPQLGVWELDLRSEFPILFVPDKESRKTIPHSEIIEKCSGCAGRGDRVCPICNADQEPGYYKENQMSQCPACHGRGLIAHKDGSDTMCVKCDGKGKIPCSTCGSRGLIKCETCRGSGSLLSRSIAVVKWKTLSTRKVSATAGAASIPGEVFHRAKGVQLCNTQAYQCTRPSWPTHTSLNKFSSEVISERAQVPPTARVICEAYHFSRASDPHNHEPSQLFLQLLYHRIQQRGIPQGLLPFQILLGVVSLLGMAQIVSRERYPFLFSPHILVESVSLFVKRLLKNKVVMD